HLVRVNNAGYSPKFTRIGLVKMDQLVDSFAINTIGPIMLTKALLTLLKKAAEANSAEPMGSNKAAVVNMSSILGSIAQNTDGGFYPYRCSKASLNMATKSMSIDFKNDGILATCVHPGWVQTDMGGANAPMSVEDSCGHLVKFIDNLSEEHNGGYFQYDGKALPW
ncbi:C-factor-like, partial [Anthonomus grandis grandis]|uniref:C-factor-like n=1 Tax=Anthonomus grandis grandis TaxID=2921223 RepID=UPI0021653722